MKLLNFKLHAAVVDGESPKIKDEEPPKCVVCNRSSKSFTAGGRCPVDGNKGAKRKG